uniref:NADH-ubiquinone oxidoreductase chain 3 n=1 Tax=Anaticola crassicornis TaxID=160206 RepID=G1EN56_9NEOP|nr:NADH dehydrogenase subunit 3 [Anaticola crassicornis]AEM23858.1 NADH dehydrogenase subunit 3 [Anaticola crassicornis]
MWMLVSSVLIIMLMMFSSMFMEDELSINSDTQFECGMESMHPNTVPMYMHFFMVAILFLVFDMEFAISLPLINIMSLITQYMFWWLFIVILMLGLAIEILYGSTNWKE